jgi:hypothetical protein
MRNSNKVLLIAAAAVLAFVVVFVLVMGSTVRDLIEKRGFTVQASSISYRPPEAANTFDLSC